MDQPQNETCAQCRTLPEDILMLTCSHDLCLVCASKLLVKEEGMTGKAIKTINCELCGASTLLDESSVEELRKVARQNGITYVERRKSIMNQDKSPSLLKSSTLSSDRSQSASKYRQSVSGTPALKPVRGMCLEHPEEEISYFCFECMCSCICPECIIHGAHRNHEVQTIKKAFPVIKGKTEDLLGQMNEKVSEMVGIEDRFNGKRKELVDTIKVMKKQVSDSFTDVRLKLDRKEKEVLTHLDIILDDANKELNFDLMTLTEKIQSFRDTSETLSSTLYNKDEIALLNYFAVNSVRILESLIRHSEHQGRVLSELGSKSLSANNMNEILEDLSKVSGRLNSLSLMTVEPQQSVKSSSSGRNLSSTTTSGKSYARKEAAAKDYGNSTSAQRSENIFSASDLKGGKFTAPSQLKNVYQQQSENQGARAGSNHRTKLKDSAMVLNSSFLNEEER